MLCCSSWQSSILRESISDSLKLFQIIKSDRIMLIMIHVVSAACSVIVWLSLAVNGMMNKLTIAGRQAQGMGIFPSFHGSSKEKARRRNSSSSCWAPGRTQRRAARDGFVGCIDVTYFEGLIDQHPSQVISESFHGASWISGKKRVEKDAPCIY